MCGPRRDRGCGRCAQRGAVHQQTLQRQGLALVRGGTTQLLPFSNILSAIGYNIWRLTARGLPHMFFMGYPLVGGRRQRHFARTNSKPRKLLKNAQTPTTCPGVSCRGSVHAVLGGWHMRSAPTYGKCNLKFHGWLLPSMSFALSRILAINSLLCKTFWMAF